MNKHSDLIKWASEHATHYISSLGNRWLHVQGVVEQALRVGEIFDEEERSYLIAAAYVHDIGYAPELKQTGLHSIDGARWLRSHSQERLASLTAYHSGTWFQAQLHGFLPDLEQFPREQSMLADALDYCDMTTGPAGARISFEERIQDILVRYPEPHIVAKATHQAKPSLSQAVKRIQQKLDEHEIVIYS
jgi:HD superfamily phosphodiesterase